MEAWFEDISAALMHYLIRDAQPYGHQALTPRCQCFYMHLSYRCQYTPVERHHHCCRQQGPRGCAKPGVCEVRNERVSYALELLLLPCLSFATFRRLHFTQLIFCQAGLIVLMLQLREMGLSLH